MSAIRLANVEARVQALEDYINNLQTAIAKMVSLEQAEQLGLLNQNDVEDLEAQVAALMSRVQTLETYHRT